MSNSVAVNSPLALGGMPRAQLLPPEFSDARVTRARTRRLIWAIALVLLIVIVGVAAAALQLAAAQAALVAEQDRTTALALEQAKYVKVTGVQDQVAAITAAQPVAAFGNILWSDYLAKVQATLPEGTIMTAFTAQIAGAAPPLSPPKVALAPHVAVLALTADSPQASVSDWLDNMKKLVGFVDANPQSVVLVPASGRYTVEVDLLINEDALAKTFEPNAVKK